MPKRFCSGPVIKRTLEQIKTCDLGSWLNETYPQYASDEYAGLQIPTLEEIFQRYGSSVNYYIETKNPEAAPGMEEELLRLMDQYGLIKPAAEDWQTDPVIQRREPPEDPRARVLAAPDPALLQRGDQRVDPGKPR